MRIGVGLPSTVPGASGSLLVEWARRAEAGAFTSLGVLDRVVFATFDPLIVLAAAAAVTQRIRLATTILISPLRSTTLLARAAASLDALSDGRLTLGLAVGARKDDYDAVGVDFSRRGLHLDEQLVALRTCWEDGTIGPHARRPGGPELLIGGSSEHALARMVRYADGYVHGGGSPQAFAWVSDKVRSAWLDAGRPGRPQLWGQGYFALGGTAEVGARYLRDYYAFTGNVVEMIVEGLLTTPLAVAQFISGYAEAGCDELVLFPTVPDIDQLDRLARVVSSLGATTGGL